MATTTTPNWLVQEIEHCSKFKNVTIDPVIRKMNPGALIGNPNITWEALPPCEITPIPEVDLSTMQKYFHNLGITRIQ
jgi:hypothetical protein